jgi:hypothetical protein
VRAALAANPAIAKDARVVRVWCEAFLGAAGADVRERLYAIALREGSPPAFSPYGQERVDGLLRWWVRTERQRRAEELAGYTEDNAKVVEPRYRPRPRRERPAQATPAPVPERASARPAVRLTQNEVIQRLDDAMAEFDRRIEEIFQRRHKP